jgi:hypothetical protein
MLYEQTWLRASNPMSSKTSSANLYYTISGTTGATVKLNELIDASNFLIFAN